MKKIIIITAITGLSLASYAQGNVAFQNESPDMLGLIDISSATAANTTAATLANASAFTVALFYGSPASVTPLASDAYGQISYSQFQGAGLSLAATAVKDSLGVNGQFNGGNVTLGVAGGYSGGSYTVNDVMAVAAWTGNYSTLALAVAGGASYGIITFVNPVGPGGTSVNIPDMTGWNSLTATPAVTALYGNTGNYPDLVMYAQPVPEPGILALAGLGGFGMLMALRRKKA